MATSSSLRQKPIGFSRYGSVTNVELVVAEKIGGETTNYVRNIYKYYVAYRLTQEAMDITLVAREQVAPTAR